MSGVDAMIALIGRRARNGELVFSMSSDSEEFGQTCLGHLRTNIAFDRIGTLVRAQGEELGFAVQIKTECDQETGLIREYLFSVEHVSAAMQACSQSLANDETIEETVARIMGPALRKATVLD